MIVTKQELFERIENELTKAMAKFPGYKNPTFLALAEEQGEVAKAILDESSENVIAEAIQLAVMACRIVLDGDCTINEFRQAKGLDKING